MLARLVGNGTFIGVTYENGYCYPLSQESCAKSTTSNGTDSVVNKGINFALDYIRQVLMNMNTDVS